MLAALSALHARGVGHGAVTAQNVIIDTDGTCVLVDVGLVPRTGSQTIESVVTTDLTWFADLVALSLAGRPVGRRRRQAPLLMGAWLPKTVPEPVRSLLRRTLDPARGAASAADAAVALADLSVAAVQLYDADWDVRARERLANASRAAMGTPSTPFTATTATTALTASTSPAAVPAIAPSAVEADAEPDIRATPARSPTRHRRKLARRCVSRRAGLASVAFGLLAVCVAIGLVLALTGGTGGPPAMTQVMTYMTPSASASARPSSPSASRPPTLPGTPTPSTTPTATATPTTSAGPNTSGNTSPSVPATSPSSASAVGPSAGSQPPAPPPTSPPSTAPGETAVTQLSILEFSYAHLLPLEAVVVVKVRTSGTGPVTLTLTFAGSNRPGMPGSNFQLSVSDTLQGHRAYVVAYRVLDIDYCFTDFWGVDVTTSPPGPASAYAQLPTLPCWTPIAKHLLHADLTNPAAHGHTVHRRVSGDRYSRVLPIGRFGGD